MTKVRTRFAPSPTGYLHIGGARTALFNWLFAKANGGEFLLRIEDTDQERNNPESVKAIFEGMRWLGLDWDLGPQNEVPTPEYYQSQRKDIYKELADRLVEEGLAYRCYLTKEESAVLGEQLAQKGGRGYQREWRKDTPELRASSAPYVIRLLAPREESIEFTDLVHGEVSVHADKAVDDFVLMKADGMATYNFACVVDDHLMGITHVLRGDDHLANTPKQICIYRALNWALPIFGHMPMILGQDKSKLSKRHGATSVIDYDAQGFLPEAVLNQLLRLGWSHGDDEIINQEEAVKLFSNGKLNHTAAVFDFTKLNFLNQHYLKTLSQSRLESWYQKHHQKSLPARWHCAHTPSLERAKSLLEVVNTVKLFEEGSQSWQTELAVQAVEKNFDEVRELQKRLEQITEENWSPETINAALPENRKLFQVVRQVITGQKISPPLDTTLHTLGRAEVLGRISTNMAVQAAKA